LDKYLKILVVAFISSNVTLATVFIFVVIIPEIEIQECRQGIIEEREYWEKECKDNYEELGFESPASCVDGALAVFDPRPCL